MCMITYLPPFVQPDYEAILNGTYFNRDGHGFAIVSKGRLHIFHGMSASKTLDKFCEMRAAHPDGPALFHSRFGTHGTIGRHNCHPFRIGGDRKTVMAHNGILPELVQPQYGDKRCDTRVCAEDLLNGWDLSNPAVRAGIGQWIGRQNKFVILTVNPNYDASAWIINESSGEWDDKTGAWYSNNGYRPWSGKGYTSYGYGGWAGEDADTRPITRLYGNGKVDTCEFCKRGYVDAYAICDECGTCADCTEHHLECNCYIPESARRTDTYSEADILTADEAAALDREAEYQSALARLALPPVTDSREGPE